MISIRWRKVFRDLWLNDIRTILAILATAIGVFGAGSILSAYAILTREIDTNYMSTNPASATVYVEAIDSQLAHEIEKLPTVAAAEARSMIRTRVLLPEGRWEPMLLFVVDDFDAMHIATFASEEGAWPPAENEILFERESVSIHDFEFGDTLAVQIPNGQELNLTYSGTVHDPGQAPGWQDGVEYGYISQNTLAANGVTPANFNQLLITVAENPWDKDHITDIAYQVKADVEAKGYTASSVVVPPRPGTHPHTDQMESMLFLYEAFGVLTLILSSVLIANIVSALLTQQTRQIGSMKAIGGRTGQIARIYFGLVLVYAVGALALGMPLAFAGGRSYSKFTAALLNFEITSDYIPVWVYLTLIGVSLVVPLVAASFPILKSSRMTVREAISDYGLNDTQFGSSRTDNILGWISGLDRPLMLSLRNTFRRRLQLLLIVGILAVGGATFMTAFNVESSWNATLDSMISSRKYNILVNLTTLYPVELFDEAIGNVEGVASYEAWGQELVVRTSDVDGTDKLRFYLTGIPPTTELVDLPPVEGRWLLPTDTNAMVVNQELINSADADMALGKTVTLRIGDSLTEWEIVGVVNEIAPRRGLGIAASAYVNIDQFTAATHTEGHTRTLRVQTADSNAATIDSVSQAIEQNFKAANIVPIDVQPVSVRETILENHIVVILAFLLVMAVLVAAVGGLSLASVISINVIERSRELGIMRSIGATTRAILRIIITESVIIGLLSWVVSIVITAPVSSLVGNYAGWIFLRTGLTNVFPVWVMFAWLGVIILVSIVASAYPAWNASQLTVREVISYE